MIKRINLVEKKALSFTYQSLVQIFLVVILINVALVGYQFMRGKWMAPKLKEEQVRLEALKADRQSLMSTPTKKKINIGEFQGLLDQLDTVPLWSKLIKEIGNNLPNSVWMTNFRSLNSSPVVANSVAQGDKTNDKAGTAAAAPPAQKPETKRFEINGVSVDVKAVAEFLTRLEKSPLFSNVTLIGSQKDSAGYQFTIQGDVILAYAR